MVLQLVWSFSSPAAGTRAVWFWSRSVAVSDSTVVCFSLLLCSFGVRNSSFLPEVQEPFKNKWLLSEEWCLHSWKNMCRGKMDSHCIEGQLSGRGTPTNAGPFPPLSLSSTPPSGPLLVSFSPAWHFCDEAVWARQPLCPCRPWFRCRASSTHWKPPGHVFASSSGEEMSITIIDLHEGGKLVWLSWTFLPGGRFIVYIYRCSAAPVLFRSSLSISYIRTYIRLNALWLFIQLHMALNVSALCALAELL